LATATPTVSDSPTPDSSSNETVKKVNIFEKYIIEVPGNFTVHETLPSSMMGHSYNFETPNGIDFTINLHPYNISSSPVPGKCLVSTDFDAGITSAPIYCEGLELTDLFTVPAGWTVKYGSVMSDLSLACTMNSPCPVEVSPDTRYSIEYDTTKDCPTKPRLARSSTCTRSPTTYVGAMVAGLPLRGVRVLQAVCVARSWFRQNGVVSFYSPPADNANR
jgi:hypothetical protein